MDCLARPNVEMLQNRDDKSRSNEEQEHRFLRGKPKREKPRNARRRSHYNWEEYYNTREDKPSTCYQYVVSLSHLFYDYLGLYIGANNSFLADTK